MSYRISAGVTRRICPLPESVGERYGCVLVNYPSNALLGLSGPTARKRPGRSVTSIRLSGRKARLQDDAGVSEKESLTSDDVKGIEHPTTGAQLRKVAIRLKELAKCL